MSTETVQHRLNGPTMGTQWSVIIDGAVGHDLAALQAALQGAVQEVDTQMSTWSDKSDLMRLNHAPCDTWVPLPHHLMRVLDAGLAISSASNGAFEMNVGDAVRAWGFGAGQIDLDAIRTASKSARISAENGLILDVETSRAKKNAPLSLDLSGTAKGYGVDRLADIASGFGVQHALCAIDGEVRALGARADGGPWSVEIEAPDTTSQLAHSMLDFVDCAVATSGDYRHFVNVKGARLGHTMDPRRGAPLVNAPASVTVMAKTCMQADALATALMVMGAEAGHLYAQNQAIDALFLVRSGGAITTLGTGLFG